MQADAVESSNVVGYSTSTTLGNGDFTQITPMFTKVDDTTKISLSDLGFTPARGDNIQMFDQYGDVTSMLEYKRRGTAASGYTYYWADINGDEVSDFDFTRGKRL